MMLSTRTPGAARVLIGLALLWTLAGSGKALAQNFCSTFPDPQNHTWDANWTDSFSESTYTLTAPCKVFVTVPFNVVVSASDPTHLGSVIGGLWSLVDTPLAGPQSGIASTLFGPSSTLAILTDATGAWSATLPVTYTGAAVNHQLMFSFTDYGHGAGAHGFGASAIGDLVVDPLPPATTPEPSSALLLLTALALGWRVRRSGQPAEDAVRAR